MKVLTIVHQFLPGHAAGSEYYTYYLAKALQARGHSLHLLTTEIDHDRPHAELGRTEFDGLPIHQAINNHKFPTFELTYEDPAMEANLRRVLDRVRPDVVHVQHLHLLSIGCIDVIKERGLKLAWTLHEYVPMCVRHGQLLRTEGELCEGPEDVECAKCARMWHAPAGTRGTDEDYLRAVRARLKRMRAELAKVDLFIAPSRFLRDKYVEHGFIRPERIVVSDYGFHTAGFRRVERTASRDLRVGFLGTIAPWKGVHVLVEAFNGLPEAGVTCDVWGDLTFLPDYVAELRDRRHHLDVKLLGKCPNDRVAEAFANLDVLVVPSLWFENSPLTIHEAFLAGVPVICSDRGGMAELVEDGVNGLHFRLGDATDLRDKIERLMKEPELLAKLRDGIPPVKDMAADAEWMEARLAELALRDPQGT